MIAVLAHFGVSIFNDITHTFWFVLLIKAAVVVVFFAMILVLAYVMMYLRQRSVWE